MSFRSLLIGLLIFVSISLVSQEYVTGLQVNEAVRIESERLDFTNQDTRAAQNEIPKVVLPFFDDFSTSNIFPNQSLWNGYSVFINKDFAYMPTNTGAATFDAIDSTGSVYKNASWIPFEADVLRSNYIRLDSVFSPSPRQLTPQDSIYLSFFYQPQGVGDAPQDFDSLVLEFSRETGDLVFSHMDSVYLPASVYMQSETDTIWPLDTLWAPDGCNPEVFTINYKIIVWGDTIPIACDSIFVPEVLWDDIWYAEGESLEEFYEKWGRNMKQVMIPITDSLYFNEKFRFRFKNYATVSNDNYPHSWKSNGDQWNVDYVYLNYNRSAADTTYRVLSFSQRAPSFLKDYQVMPYRQYRYSPLTNMKVDIDMFITNLDNIEHNTRYSYIVNQVAGNFGYGYDGGSCNLKPFYEVGFQNCNGCGAAHACPPVNSLFSLDYDRDTTSYIIKHFISDSSDQNSIVDSAIYRQGFYNYYAYDDGTPEKGWGVDGAGGSQIAYKFSLDMADTIWGVQIYFNRTLNDANEFYFDLVIWSDNNGKPGERIYTEPGQKVSWEKGLYAFYPYMLSEPQIVSGTIYVGFEKLQKDNMNIGLDANNDNSGKIFYKTTVDWETSSVSGSLLIRPIVGSELVLSAPENPQDNKAQLSIYPNPANNWFSIGNADLLDDQNSKLQLISMFGQTVKSHTGIPVRISTTGLQTGIYIVRVESKGNYYTAKLFIN